MKRFSPPVFIGHVLLEFMRRVTNISCIFTLPVCETLNCADVVGFVSWCSNQLCKLVHMDLSCLPKNEHQKRRRLCMEFWFRHPSWIALRLSFKIQNDATFLWNRVIRVIHSRWVGKVSCCHLMHRLITAQYVTVYAWQQFNNSLMLRHTVIGLSNGTKKRACVW